MPSFTTISATPFSISRFPLRCRFLRMQARTSSDVMPNSATFIADSPPIFTRFALLRAIRVQARASSSIVSAPSTKCTATNSVPFFESFSFWAQFRTCAWIMSSAVAIRATATSPIFQSMRTYLGCSGIEFWASAAIMAFKSAMGADVKENSLIHITFLQIYLVYYEAYCLLNQLYDSRIDYFSNDLSPSSIN